MPALPDPLLASRIPLPEHPEVYYARLTPTGPTTDPIERARTSLVSSTTGILHATLSSVHVGHKPFIYLFKIAQEGLSNPLVSLTFDGLAVDEISSFTPPCISSLLPNPDKRVAISHFYEAIRSRIIDDVVNTSTSKTSSGSRQVKRFKGGFLMSKLSSSSDWEYKAITRPLIFCQLQVHFSYSPEGLPSNLVIHPTLLPTPFLDLAPSLPLPPGTPITLLPFGTPAFFLATYTGPSSGLIKQFQSSLQGLGAGDWTSLSNPTFIIGWIQVENKQGEDKGITIIYPTKLCLSYMPHSSSRTSLDYIPELPAPLQPSPHVPPTLPSLLETGRPASTPTSHPRRPSIFTTPTSDSLHSFRSLTLSKGKDLRSVATEVGGYVDAIARERERERERLKRERENGTGSSPKLSRTTATTPAAAPTPTAFEPPTTVPQSATPLALPGPSHPPPPPSSSLQPPMIIQSFYPSPPQSAPSAVPPSEARTSPAVSTAPTPMDIPTPAAVTAPIPIPTTVQPTPSASISAYDPYTMDSTWSQPVDGSAYLGMDIEMDFGMEDIGMNFGMNMGSMTGPTVSNDPGVVSYANNRNGSGGTVGAASGMGMEFEDAFTDDDFSFFDRPSRPSAPNSNSHSRAASGSHTVAATGISPPTFGDMHLSSGPGPPGSYSAMQNAQMWTPGGIMDGFTPRSVVDNADSVPFEMLPPSPGPGLTPESHSAPPTPNVHLEFESAVPTAGDVTDLKRPKLIASTSTSLFEPIPFSQYHRQSDGKYAIGKFAMHLPSPPPEDDHDGVASSPSSSEAAAAAAKAARAFISLPASPSGFGSSSGWRFRYNSVTDPRIAVVKKLIGVKRKPPFEHTMRKKVPWTDREDWESPRAADMADEGEEESVPRVSAESEGDSEEEEEDAEMDDTASSPNISRPATPPPSYLPLGPTLLATHFQHASLLPLSTPLRPPGASITPLNLSSTPAQHPLPSVPTPVSPAATMGAASEKSRSLEAAAFAIAAEVVENPIWAETWRANAVGAKAVPGMVWAADVRAVARLLDRVSQLHDMDSGLGLDAWFGLEPDGTTSSPATTPSLGNEQKSRLQLQPLEAPLISVGKGEAVIQVVPTALRFWEKLGLSPKGGKKDVSTFVLFEGDMEKQGVVGNWLAGVVNAYQGKHYGLMTTGKSSSCTRDGLIALRFDATFRKTLSAFMSTLTDPRPTTIVFLVLPMTLMTLSSPVLRQILSASKKVLSNYQACQLIFEFVPEPHVYDSLEKSTTYESALDILASSVYNRILSPVDRLHSRRLHNIDDDKEGLRSYLPAPAFTLARPWHNKVSYVRSAHTSLDVMDRYTLLHVAYRITPCGKWIVACCIDQRGENYDFNVWLTQSTGDREQHGHESDDEQENDGSEPGLNEEDYVVKKVWDFAMMTAKKTDVEWRVVFARLGVPSDKEMNAWGALFDANVVSSRERPPLHHSLVCVVPDAPWLFVTPKCAPTSMRPRPAPGRSPSSSKSHVVFADTSTTTYSIFPSSRMPISLPPSQRELTLSQTLVPELPHPLSSPQSQPTTTLDMICSTPPTHIDLVYSSHSALAHPLTLLPQSTSILIHIPHQSSSPSLTVPSSPIAMTHIHLLQTYHSASYMHQSLQSSSSQASGNEQLLLTVTQNYHELAVLSKVRWKLDGLYRGLPFHLAAVDAIQIALDKDWDRQDLGLDGYH